MKPRIFSWVQSRLGLGHLSRALNLAGALDLEGFDVTLAHGGMPSRSAHFNINVITSMPYEG